MPSTALSKPVDLTNLVEPRLHGATTPARVSGGSETARPFSELLSSGGRNASSGANSAFAERGKCCLKDQEPATAEAAIDEAGSSELEATETAEAAPAAAQVEQAMAALLFQPLRPESAPLPTDLVTPEDGTEEVESQEAAAPTAAESALLPEDGTAQTTFAEAETPAQRWLARPTDADRLDHPIRGDSRFFGVKNPLEEHSENLTAAAISATTDGDEQDQTDRSFFAALARGEGRAAGQVEAAQRFLAQRGFAVTESVLTPPSVAAAPDATGQALRMLASPTSQAQPIQISTVQTAAQPVQTTPVRAAGEGESQAPLVDADSVVSETKSESAEARPAISAETSRSPKTSDRTRVLPLDVRKKFSVLNVESKVDIEVLKSVGTIIANQGETSMSPHRPTPIELSSAIPEVTVRSSETSPATEVRPSLAAQAVKAVEDVREISAGLSAQRRHVTLQLDFGTEGRLDVKVEVRNGEIRTEFRTDSTEVRAALQQAWNSQGLAQEGRARLSDPVFLPQARDNGSQSQSFADAHARQQRQAETLSFAPAGARSASTVATPAAAPSSSPVVASDRQLHAFA